jgi:hypothetical protein
MARVKFSGLKTTLWAGVGPEPSYLALGDRITLFYAIGVLDEAENFFQFSHPSSCKVAT